MQLNQPNQIMLILIEAMRLLPSNQKLKINFSINTSNNIKWNVLYIYHFFLAKEDKSLFCYVVLSRITKTKKWCMKYCFYLMLFCTIQYNIFPQPQCGVWIVKWYVWSVALLKILHALLNRANRQHNFTCISLTKKQHGQYRNHDCRRHYSHPCTTPAH